REARAEPRGRPRASPPARAAQRFFGSVPFRLAGEADQHSQGVAAASSCRTRAPTAARPPQPGRTINAGVPLRPEPERGASGGPATQELLAWTAGDPAAAERLMPHVYAELRVLAAAVFRGQRADQTLQPTALVHEAFLRLIDPARVAVRDRAHFRALASKAMR